MRSRGKQVFKRISFFALLLIGTAPITGCGSSSSSSDEPLPKATYIDESSAICEKTLEEEQGALAELSQGNPGQINSAEQKKFFEEELFPRIAGAVDQLRELSPPPQDEAAVERYLRELKAGLQRAEEDPMVFASGKVFSQANSEARSIGLRNCVF